MEVKGRVIEKPASITGTSQRGPWRKAALVIRYEDGQYPKDILLTNMKKAEEFERIPKGATGTFKFDGRVSSKDGRFYQDLECWQWTLDQQPAAPQAPPAATGGEPF